MLWHEPSCSPRNNLNEALLTPRLVLPRWETPVPAGVTGSYGPAIIRFMRAEFGIRFGPWQAYAITNALRHDRNGDLIARIALISTGRQNGKTVIVRGLFDWLLDMGQRLPPFLDWTTLLAAAHDAKQARVMYKRVKKDIDNNARMNREMRATDYAGISAGHLDFDIVTGQPGSVRGDSAGAIAWDEMLTQRDWEMWEALAPTQSAQRSPIMLLTSTAGTAESIVLRTFYDRLKRMATGDEKPDRMFYGAWWQSQDPDAATTVGKAITAEEWLQIRQANPGLGDGHLSRNAIILDHSTMPVDSWRRERLNHFVDVVAPGAFNPGVWAACRTPEPLAGLTGPYALGVDVQPGWERATICVAGMREDGRVGTEVYRDIRAEPSNPVTAERIIAEVAAFPDMDQVYAIAYDAVSGAAPAFLRHATEKGLPWDALKPAAVMAACMDVTEMILSGRLAVDDPLLDAQIPLAARRDVGQDGGFRFARAASLGPIDAVMAMTFAAHAITFAWANQPSIY
jgi:hypothetical protein